MPADWIPNCGSQLERAIRALLVSTGAATMADCYISNDPRERIGLATGITDIQAVQSNTEPEISGNEKWAVRIQNKFGVPTQPGEANPNVNRIEMDTRVGRQMLELLRSNDGMTLFKTADNITAAGRALAVSDGSTDGDIQAENEADMAEFTCLFVRWLGSSRGQPDDASCSWVEVRNFEITACPSAIN